MVRSGNEDSFFAEADSRRGVFMVADGMGGHAAGEVA
ncbi:MAG: serine/threonine-protein phosphatase, partial [Gemmatimonadaceae bacterium]|nr:serine/threonine-protein phosphatase [Gemmatimonadaceae bacterium]